MSEDTEVLPNVNNNQQAIYKPSLSQAAAENLRTGVLLMCKEALVTAIQDRRLHRGHLSVLATLVQFMSSRTAKAWPGRAAIAAINGMPVKTVSNLLLELRNFAYLIAEREAVEEAGNRNLTVYTFGNIDHETIRREITKFVESVRVARSPEALRGEPEVPPQRDAKSPAPTGQSRPNGNNSPAPAGLPSAKVPPQRVGKSRQDGDSNSKKGTHDLVLQKKPACSSCNLDIPHVCSDGFSISRKHELHIPAEVVGTWANRFPDIPDLPAKLETLSAYLLNKGFMHHGWNQPIAWMAGCLSKDNQEHANATKVTNAKVVRTQPKKPTLSRW
jgi:hypothetical protein